MKIFKNSGLTYAQTLIDLINNRFSDVEGIKGSVEGFNNCREQGLILRLYDSEYKDGLTLYIHNNRWSDEPTITWEDKISYETLYSEEAFSERTYTNEHIDLVLDKAVELINKKFKVGE